MTALAALVLLSLPSADVLGRFAPGELTRRPVEGLPLTEVLALGGRSGRWLERDGRVVPATPEGAAELAPPASRAAAELLVARFERGTVVTPAQAARVVSKVPGASPQDALTVTRLLARARADGGAELVQVVLHFQQQPVRREERVLLEVPGAAPQNDAPPGGAPASSAVAQFWAKLVAP